MKEVSILSIRKRSMVIPKPAMPPVVKMVISKNLRPWNATTRPKRIARVPKIYGRLTKNEANLVTENTGQALEWVPVITGAHTSSLVTLRLVNPIELSTLSQ